MCLQLPVCFSELFLYVFILFTKIWCLIKEKFIELVLLFDLLQNYTIESFPSYRVTELLVKNHIIVKCGL